MLQRGTSADRYVVEDILGEGGMAVVYRVRHAELGSSHAMKVLSLRSPAIQDRMLQEGRIQACVRHPNIVSVTDVVRIDGAPALVMEFIEGPSLDLLLHAFRLNLAQADDLAHGILRGVAHAHRQGLVHRDLKPGNVLVVEEGDTLVPKVTDFGLAKVVTDNGSGLRRPTRSGITMGTPTFMAPEQFRDAKNVDARADVFSLGAMLYEMVTGHPAFVGSDPIQLHGDMMARRYLPVRDRVPVMPDRMVRAIDAALQPDPPDRPASVDALLAMWRGEDRGEVWAPLVVGSPWSVADRVRVRALVPVGVKHAPAEPSLAVEPTVTPSLLSEPPTPSPRKFQLPREPRRVIAWVVLWLLFTGSTVGVVAAAGLWFAMQESAWDGASEAVGAPVEGEAGPGPDVESPPAPVETRDAPVPEPVATRDAPSESASVAAPRSPAPSRPPEAVVTPAPAPAPPPVPPPAPAVPADAAQVVVHGVERARLVSPDGSSHPVGAVAPGSYHLVAFFEPGVPTRVMALELTSGQVVEVNCVAAMGICR